MNDAVVAQGDRALTAVTLEEVGGSIPPAAISLRCVISTCPNLVPKKRLTMKAKYTCSVECLAALNAFLKEQRNNRRCAVCSHPASLAEREEFKLWRKSRGETQGRKSNRVKALEDALTRAMNLLQCAQNHPLPANEVGAALEVFENLLDAKSGKGSTLAPSGLAPDEVQGET